MRFIILGTYHNKAEQELFHAQYLIFNLGLSQNFYFHTGFPAQLLVPSEPYRQKKWRNPRGLEPHKIQGNQDVDAIHVKKDLGKPREELK